MEHLITLATDPAVSAASVTLIAMEIVLGIDNLIFIAILSNKLPEQFRARARRVGIGLALIMRLVLLASIAWIVQLTEPIASVLGRAFSWRDIILIVGGLFLVWKATREIHYSVDLGPEPDMFDEKKKVAVATFGAAIVQIILLDIVFSIDSIITAAGMTDHLPVMVIAVIVAIAVMMLAADPLADFINKNPTIVMLALGFLLMIGTTLIAEGCGVHVPKGYIYTAMAFSAAVEGLNILARNRRRAQEERG